jgi:hypothetical protein
LMPSVGIFTIYWQERKKLFSLAFMGHTFVI